MFLVCASWGHHPGDHSSRVLEGADVNMRECRCGKKFPRTPEFWGKNKKNPDGLQYFCKICQRENNSERLKRAKETALRKQEEATPPPGARRVTFPDSWKVNREGIQRPNTTGTICSGFSMMETL